MARFIENKLGLWGTTILCVVSAVIIKVGIILNHMDVGDVFSDNAILILSVFVPIALGTVVTFASELLYGTSGLIAQLSSSAESLLMSAKSLDQRKQWFLDLEKAMSEFLVAIYRYMKYAEGDLKIAKARLIGVFDKITEDMQANNADNSLAFLLTERSEMLKALRSAEERLQRNVFPSQLMTSLFGLAGLIIVVMFEKTDVPMIGVISTALIAGIGSLQLLTIIWADESRGTIGGQVSTNLSSFIVVIQEIGGDNAVVAAVSKSTVSVHPMMKYVNDFVKGYMIPLLMGFVMTLGSFWVVFVTRIMPDSVLGGIFSVLALLGIGIMVRPFEREMGIFIIIASVILIFVLPLAMIGR